MSNINVLNISETTKGGIETFMNSLRTSEFVNNEFLLPDYDFSIYKYTRSNKRFNNLIHLIIILYKLDFKKYNFIFLHSTFAGLLRPILYLFSFFYDFKVVYCSHGWSWDMSEKGILSKYIYVFVEYVLSFFCHGVVCVSNHDYFSANKYNLRNLKVIQNGVRDTQLKNIDKHSSFTANFLFVGRLDRQKGLFEFLNSINQVNIPYEINLKVIGMPVVDDIHKFEFLKSNKFKNINVEFLGWVDNADLDSYYFESDVTIIPSLYEAFGLVVIESIRNSTPVLVSNKGALPLIVTDEIGWVYDIDNLKSLEDSLCSINKESVLKRSSTCRDVFSRLYHQDIMNKDYFLYFKSIAA